MTTDNLCPRCVDCPETIMHVIRDYEDVRDFWMSKLNPDVVSKFFSLGLHSWLTWNLKDPNMGNGSFNWHVFFGVAVYELWKDRNSLVFSRRTQLECDLHFLSGFYCKVGIGNAPAWACGLLLSFNYSMFKLKLILRWLLI